VDGLKLSLSGELVLESLLLPERQLLNLQVDGKERFLGSSGIHVVDKVKGHLDA
jgi:hypothetical protein